MLHILSLSLMILVLISPAERGAQMSDKRPEKPKPAYTTDHEEMMSIISKRARELKTKRQQFDSTDPLPPWEVIFNIPMTHMAWRMGSGEDYRQKFYRFFFELDQHNRENYIMDYPEPEGWSGYYQMLIDRSGENSSGE